MTDVSSGRSGIAVRGVDPGGAVSPRRHRQDRPEGVPPGEGEDLARLRSFPRAGLGRWPTPIHRCAVNGDREILVKRDDLCGWGRGGAKARKIEGLVGYLTTRGHDEVITVAGNVTTVVFDLLPALDRFGIRARLFILDDPPASPANRELVFHGVRPRVHLLGRSRTEVMRRCALAFARSRARGGRPFLLLPSLSHPAAVVGNACGFLEMAAQLRAVGQPLPGTVFVTVASGTMLAGFLLAENALRHAGHEPVHIVGVQVYPGRVHLWTRGMLRWSECFLGMAGRVPEQRIEIVPAALHGGFARFPGEIAGLCDRVRRETGMHIDPIFGGKTWSIMEQHLRSTVAPVRPVMFWHCGYTPEWRVLASAPPRGEG